MEKRNDFVVYVNEMSKKLSKILNILDYKLVNIMETERDTVFKIVYDLEKQGINFWKEDFILREAILTFFISLIEDSIRKIDNTISQKYLLKKSRQKAYKEMIEYYLEINKIIENYDYKSDFYNRLYNYCDKLVPTSKNVGAFYKIYSVNSEIADKLNIPDNEYKEDLFELMTTKEKEANDLKQEDISGLDELNRLLEFLSNNDFEVLKEYEETLEYEENKTKKLHF